MKTAERSFQFVTASYLVLIGNHKATNLAEFCEGLEKSTDASVFYHTFQSLTRHHFLTEGFSNDFAQWVLAALNRAELAEQLASLDIRDYLSLAELRNDLCRTVSEYIGNNPEQTQQKGFEPFFFCEAVEIAVPLGVEVWSLEDFRKGLERLSHASFHYHFIASRLRLHLSTNDFSYWLDTSLGLRDLAQKVNRVDIYTNTIEGARERLISLVDLEMAR